MDYRPYTELISSSLIANGDLPAFTDFPGGTLTYRQTASRVKALHDLFRREGIRTGDRIAMCGRNCSNWAVSFIAATTYGTVAVPLLHEFTPENIVHALKHSGSRVFFVTEEIWKKLDGNAELSGLLCISLTTMSVIDGVIRMPIECEDISDVKGLCDSFHRYDPEDMLVLNYTSGTTSNPKGVMLPERAVVSNILFGYEVMPVLKRGHTVVSLLPMAHTYSMSFELLTEFTLGMRIYFLTGRMHSKYLLEAFGAAKPKVIIMVPLILEKIVKKGVFPVISKPAIKFLRSIPLVRKAVNHRICRELCGNLGGNFYQVIIGGAGLDPEVESLLLDIRFPFTVGYGMTECSPIICYSDWKEFKASSCGRAAPRMNVRIDRSNGSESGEILVSGDNVMIGYYNNEQATREVFDDWGWLHTGDIGRLDAKGNLYILGRCKTMFLSASGQNVYPEEIEAVVSGIKYVMECLAVKRGEQVQVLVYPDIQEMKKDGFTDEDICDYRIQICNTANNELPPYSRIASVVYQDVPFEKTPKMSIKRYLYN